MTGTSLERTPTQTLNIELHVAGGWNYGQTDGRIYRQKEYPNRSRRTIRRTMPPVDFSCKRVYQLTPAVTIPNGLVENLEGSNIRHWLRTIYSLILKGCSL